VARPTNDSARSFQKLRVKIIITAVRRERTASGIFFGSKRVYLSIAGAGKSKCGRKMEGNEKHAPRIKECRMKGMLNSLEGFYFILHPLFMVRA